MMGWWKPFFFTDTGGVQILLESATIDSTQPSTFWFASAFIAFLCIVDRWAAHYALHKFKRQHSIYMSTAIWTIQRFTSGLLMLIMMSFNVILFMEVVLFSGFAELGIRIYWIEKYEEHEISFQRVSTAQDDHIEMEDCM